MTSQQNSSTVEVQRDAATEVSPATTVWCTPPSATACYLSIVVPAYNEEKRLPASLQKIEKYLQSRDFSYEMIVVDDGSRDGTREVISQFAATRPWVRLLHYDSPEGHPLNRGKGYAVRRAFCIHLVEIYYLPMQIYLRRSQKWKNCCRLFRVAISMWHSPAALCQLPF